MKRIAMFLVPVALMLGMTAEAAPPSDATGHRAIPPSWQITHQAGEEALAQQQYETAEANFFKALVEAQKYYESGAEDGAVLLGRSFNDLGVVYHAEGDLEKAEAYFEKSLKLYGNNPDLRVTLVNLAAIYQEQGRLDDMEALIESYRPTETVASNPDALIAVSVYELANRFMKKGQYNEAARMYKKLLSWMPVKPEPGNALYALRPDILQRLADVGQPVAVETDAVSYTATVAEEQPVSYNAMQPTPLPNDAVFKNFISTLDQQVKSQWSPPDYYKHIPVTVMMVLNKKGQLLEYHLKESSGFHPADSAALEAVRGAAPYAPFPKQYQREHVVVEFNFN